jgi:hypothetical protein
MLPKPLYFPCFGSSARPTAEPNRPQFAAIADSARLFGALVCFLHFPAALPEASAYDYQ